MTAQVIRRRFLVLTALRWLSSGLMIPVLILLLLERGLSLGQIGLVTAAQGVVVMLLELPTGGLADTIGRRTVLLISGLFELAAVSLFIVADTVPLLIAVFALMGVYRALDSGPLDAWYVDAAQAVDPDADIEGGMAAAGVVLGIAIAAGTMASGGLVAWQPLPGVAPLITPLLVALLLKVLHLLAVAWLMTEPTVIRTAFSASVQGLPRVVADAITMVRSSPVLLALLAVELLWGLGQTSFEAFTPARLEAVVGDPDRAAVLLGPANAVAWLVSAGGAAVVPALSRKVGAPMAGALLRVGQGLTVVGIALGAGPIGVLIAYVLTMAVHGGANPVHQGLLHRAVTDPSRRATVVSANSLTAQSGGALGGIALGALADTTTLSTAMLVGAAILAAAAPLYLFIGRRDGQTHPSATMVHPDHI